MRWKLCGSRLSPRLAFSFSSSTHLAVLLLAKTPPAAELKGSSRIDIAPATENREKRLAVLNF